MYWTKYTDWVYVSVRLFAATSVLSDPAGYYHPWDSDALVNVAGPYRPNAISAESGINRSLALYKNDLKSSSSSITMLGFAAIFLNFLSLSFVEGSPWPRPELISGDIETRPNPNGNGTIIEGTLTIIETTLPHPSDLNSSSLPASTGTDFSSIPTPSFSRVSSVSSSFTPSTPIETSLVPTPSSSWISSPLSMTSAITQSAEAAPECRN
ncbi:hypothetical protein K435DRAFT_855848 [Dendrothele bispora CBS 962.96]|uniref:Uncharacterized protein n=1 Tax=Dendrothele bispora (strain CBS 962.96) TaxID=1314807 RepID=A0A4S8MBD1_DENBC|nr:hypothetical protein K435DRAFT_855848 [Dendrothele bispora CBS 962.96]